MGDRKTNPFLFKAIVYLTVAAACFALLLVRLYVWEERSLLDIAKHERLADVAVVVIVVVIAYMFYERFVKSID